MVCPGHGLAMARPWLCHGVAVAQTWPGHGGSPQELPDDGLQRKVVFSVLDENLPFSGSGRPLGATELSLNLKV
jgi:hypothetical protein